MANTVIVGAQWGDEGKGKLVDMLSANSDIVVRFQGGNNAGHTIYVNGNKTVLHSVPSGILYPGKLCLVGNGVVLDPFDFLEELDNLEKSGADISPARLGVSLKTQLIMPYHRALDRAREAHKAKSGKKIGTTGRGIGPCYEDKAARVGIRAGDLLSPERLRAKIKAALEEKNALLSGLYGVDALDPEKVASDLLAVAPRLTPYLKDVGECVQSASDAGKSVLWEGAQGIHLDIDHGTYPFVTSSNTVAAYAAIGVGVGPQLLKSIIGIAKAYTTRVGSGPFPTELLDETGEYLRKAGNEFGATTGRPRRCGWIDAVILRETARLCGLTSIALTKLDVLRGLPAIKVCVAYDYKGQRLQYPPQEENSLADVTPVFEELPGFSEDISACKRFEELPANAQSYVKRLEVLTGVAISHVSVGPDREQTIVR